MGIVNGEALEVRVTGARFENLLVHDEEFPLMGLALKLDGKMLVVTAGGVVSSTNATEKCFHIEFDDADAALEMALALKALRGHADTGAGVFAWGERAPDYLSPPDPVE